MRNVYTILGCNLNKIDHMEDLCAAKRIALKWILEKLRLKMGVGLKWLRI
jgi:hypothetical protein